MLETRFSSTALELDPAAATAELAAAIRRDVLHTLRRRGGALGVSGGVDSAVTLALCVEAIGADRVVAVLMPERESSTDSLRLGSQVADQFGVETVVEDLTAALAGMGCYSRRDAAIRRVFPDYTEGWSAKIGLPGGLLDEAKLNVFELTVVEPSGEARSKRLKTREYLQIVASTNFKQRLRMAMVYHHAELRNYCVVGTSNRNEYDHGFFVKHGDGGYDIGPIRHLYKTQVYQLAAHLGIPNEIREAVPTTDTYSAPSSQEEFFFRLPFPILDLICFGLDHEVPAAEVADVLELDEPQVLRVYDDLLRKRRTTEFMRKPPMHYPSDPVDAGETDR